MTQKQKRTRDFLIRKMPIELFFLLEKEASENHRSKNQEAIIALSNGLSIGRGLEKPKPFDWNAKITSKMIREAIEEGRE